MRLVLLAACAALMLTACASEKRPGPTHRIVVAALGDSIMAGSPYYDPDPQQRKLLGFGSDEKSQWEYWAAKKDPRLEFRNCGVYGQPTDEIARRLERCAKGADVLIVQGGISDITQGRSVESAAANLRRMVRRGKVLGLRVALADLLPWNNGYPAADPKIRRLNELIYAIGREESVRVLRFRATLEDPTHPGHMREELTADGDYPSIEGYRLLGERAFALP